MKYIRTNKRKRIYLVNRDFQLRHTKSAVIIGLMSTALTALVILFPLYEFKILRIPKFLPWPVLTSMGLAAVINIGIVAFMGIMVTHRIAGPMYSLVRSLRRVAMGRFDRLMGQRDGDELKFVVRNFNDMLQGLQSMTARDLETLSQFREKLKPLERDKDGETLAAELDALVARLGQRLRSDSSEAAVKKNNQE